MIKVGMKREITLIAFEKRLEDLYHATDVHLIGIHCLAGFPKRAHKLDARERLENVLLDVVKYLSDSG